MARVRRYQRILLRRRGVRACTRAKCGAQPSLTQRWFSLQLFNCLFVFVAIALSMFILPTVIVLVLLQQFSSNESPFDDTFCAPVSANFGTRSCDFGDSQRYDSLRAQILPFSGRQPDFCSQSRDRNSSHLRNGGQCACKINGVNALWNSRNGNVIFGPTKTVRWTPTKVGERAVSAKALRSHLLGTKRGSGQLTSVPCRLCSISDSACSSEKSRKRQNKFLLSTPKSSDQNLAKTLNRLYRLLRLAMSSNDNSTPDSLRSDTPPMVSPGVYQRLVMPRPGQGVITQFDGKNVT